MRFNMADRQPEWLNRVESFMHNVLWLDCERSAKKLSGELKNRIHMRFQPGDLSPRWPFEILRHGVKGNPDDLTLELVG
jgi:hypothetical protein